jgi:hypothetical protein
MRPEVGWPKGAVAKSAGKNKGAVLWFFGLHAQPNDSVIYIK